MFRSMFLLFLCFQLDSNAVQYSILHNILDQQYVHNHTVPLLLVHIFRKCTYFIKELLLFEDLVYSVKNMI